MAAEVEDTVLHGRSHVRASAGRAARGDPQAFWAVPLKRRHASMPQWRHALRDLVGRVMNSTGVTLFEAVEAGVPTFLVHVIAGATGESLTEVLGLIGVSPTTFRRKEAADEPLPEVAGHCVVGLLRVAATLRRLLDESGDPALLKDFDMEGWLVRWMRQLLPELGGKTPAQLLRNLEGQRAVEQVLQRMRGGLAA